MNKSVRKAVRCFLIKDDKVVAIKYKEGNNKDYYDIPGGKIEENENSIQATIREFKEETGIEITNPMEIGKAYIECPNLIFDLDLFIVDEYKGEPQKFYENDSGWIEIDNLLKQEKKLPTIELLKYINKGNKINIKISADEKHNIKYLTTNL